MKLEPRVVRLITTITEYQCNDCKQGLVVRDKGCNTIQFTDPPRFKHICIQCNKVDWLSGEYPLFKNAYVSDGETSASDAERITNIEQTISGIGTQIERMMQEVRSIKSGWSL